MPSGDPAHFEPLTLGFAFSTQMPSILKSCQGSLQRLAQDQSLDCCCPAGTVDFETGLVAKPLFEVSLEDSSRVAQRRAGPCPQREHLRPHGPVVMDVRIGTSGNQSLRRVMRTRHQGCCSAASEQYGWLLREAHLGVALDHGEAGKLREELASGAGGHDAGVLQRL